MECRVEHEKRNSISTSNHVLFCWSYKHNSTPHGKVELINENRKIDNPRLKIVKCVDTSAQDEKCVESLQKQQGA